MPSPAEQMLLAINSAAAKLQAPSSEQSKLAVTFAAPDNLPDTIWAAPISDIQLLGDYASLLLEGYTTGPVRMPKSLCENLKPGDFYYSTQSKVTGVITAEQLKKLYTLRRKLGDYPLVEYVKR